MKTKIVNLFFLSFFLSFVISCRENSPEIEAKNVNTNETWQILVPLTAQPFDAFKFREITDKQGKDAEDFAKLLAVSLKDNELRSFLKEEANKKFDGDYDILVSKVLDSKIGNETFKSKFLKSSPTSLLKLNQALNNEKLNISIPLWIENWEADKNELLVVARVGAVEGETEYLKAFDSNGKVYIIDANKEPELPVIVVGNNERMGYDPNTFKGKGTRTSGNYEKITWIKCPNLGDIESWYMGGPELRFEGVVYNNTTGSATKIFRNDEYPPSRHHASDGYTLSIWTADQNLFRWYFEDEHGPNYYIQSYEIDDSGVQYKFSVGVSVGKKDVVTGTANFELTYKKQDRLLKGELVRYTNPSPATLADANIQFKLEN